MKHSPAPPRTHTGSFFKAKSRPADAANASNAGLGFKRSCAVASGYMRAQGEELLRKRSNCEREAEAVGIGKGTLTNSSKFQTPAHPHMNIIKTFTQVQATERWFPSGVGSASLWGIAVTQNTCIGRKNGGVILMMFRKPREKKLLALQNELNSGVTHSPVAVLAAEATVQLNGLRRETIGTRSKNAKMFRALLITSIPPGEFGLSVFFSELVFPRNIRKANDATLT
jgi:hypothetical protein